MKGVTCSDKPTENNQVTPLSFAHCFGFMIHNVTLLIHSHHSHQPSFQQLRETDLSPFVSWLGFALIFIQYTE